MDTVTCQPGALVPVYALLSLVSCAPSTQTPPPTPPPAALAHTAQPARRQPPPAPASPTAAVPAQYVMTEDSDQWVEQSFQVQERYDRVILVDASGAPARQVAIPPLTFAADPAPAAAPPRAAEITVKTLQAAVDMSRGGDLIAVSPGTYRGFVMGKRPGAGPGKYIRIVALGPPGATRIEHATMQDPRWMAWFRGAQYVIFEGFHLIGQSRSGEPAPDTARAGIFIDGNFRQSGEMAHHIALLRVASYHHRRWGMHATDSHTVLMQDSFYGYSATQHGAYVSDGSDDYVIRRNVFQGNHWAGLQCNLDPDASMQELAAHPSMHALHPLEPNRAWVEETLAAATERFGDGRFPDGRGVNFIIEDNVLTDNGRGGAAALNLAAMSRSLIQNNLIYANHAHGIAQWDNDNSFDADYRVLAQGEPGPARPPAALPMFGCHENLIRHNTVLMANPGRAALQARNGSWGMRAYNNILINDSGPSLQIYENSRYGLEVGPNLAGALSYVDAADQPAPAPPELLSSVDALVLGYTQARIAAEFVRPSQAPWAVLDGRVWRRSPSSPDFRPTPTSSVLVGRAHRDHMPPRDLLGRARTTATLGALAP